MQQELLPLFPLSVVLFPRTQLPLHIFEERYKEMIAEAIRDQSEFGVVLAADDGVVSTGCTAVVDSVTHRYPDGKLDIVTVGVRRFEIQSLDTDKAYLRGAVDFFNDEDTGKASVEEREQAVAGFRKMCRFLQEGSPPEPSWDDPQLSFQLAQAVQDLDFRQQMLTSRSESERIHELAQFFPRHVAHEVQIRHVHKVAPSNGHGRGGTAL